MRRVSGKAAISSKARVTCSCGFSMLEPSAMAARSLIRALLVRRGPRVGLALAAPAAALLLRPRLVAHQHAIPVIRARFLEALPPPRDLLRRVRARRAQR